MIYLFHFPKSAELKVTTEGDPQYPWESVHRITVSLEGFEPVSITLPHAVLSKPLKAELDDNIVEIILAKAVDNLWPEDVVEDELRLNAETLEPWTNERSLNNRLQFQFPVNYMKKPNVEERYTNALAQSREVIRSLFILSTQNGHLLFKLQLNGSKQTPEWLIRAHPPARMSPDGNPVLVLSALDHRHAERLQTEGKWDGRLPAEEFRRVAGDSTLTDEVITIPLYSAEEVRLVCFILRLNSTKMLPTSWQKEHLPLEDPASPWLATFVRPLYTEGLASVEDLGPHCCTRCQKTSTSLKSCGRCKTASYCSADCQRTDWASHKPSCSKA